MGTNGQSKKKSRFIDFSIFSRLHEHETSYVLNLSQSIGFRSNDKLLKFFCKDGDSIRDGKLDEGCH